MVYRLLVLLFIAAIMGLASCKNNDEVFAPVVTTGLNVVNASADTLNFYLNGTRQNNSSSLFPGGQSLYLTVPAGLATYQFKNLGSFNALFSVPLTLKDSMYYSLYLAGASADKAFVTLDLLQQDTVLNSTQIKFVNASPDAGNLDFYVGDTVNYKSLAFKGTTAFFPTGSGLKLVKIYQAGSVNPIKDTSIVFEPNSIYTLFSMGLLKGKGTAAFGFGVALNSAQAGP